MDRKPEVVVITGASAGLGRATAEAFAKRGAHIALMARGRAGLEAARTDVEKWGGKGLALPCDVADATAVEAAAAQAEEVLGPIDIWVNNAMVTVMSPAHEMTPEEFKRVTEVNYLGYVYGTLAALRRMRPRDQGAIVQVGSALAYRSIPLQSAYCASKHAILGFTMSLRSELLHDGSKVRVTMVQMPALNTPQFAWCKTRLPYKPQPVPPIFQPEVGAEAIYWAAHHDRREVVVGGSSELAVQLNKLVPGLMDRYLAWTGYKSQERKQTVEPNRQDDLWHPLDDSRDYGAHGSFDSQASDSSKQLWLNEHRGAIGLAVAGVGATVGALLSRKL